MSKKQKKYIPALKFHWLTRLYDPLMKMMKIETLKKRLIMEADLLPNQRILDLASGTGTFALMLKEIQPRAAIIGLDADPQVLEIAQQKATNKRIDITFQQGLSSDLPFEDDQLDKVFSSLFFHHLTLDMKQKTLEEAFRVLTPGGDIYILDFDRPQNLWTRIAFFSIQLLDGFETTRDHVKGVILESLHEEGFTEVKETDHFNTIAGTIRLYHARKPV